MNNETFAQIVSQNCAAGNLFPLRTVVEKELLHYDILFALSEHGLLSKLTFQGGTALRLCYGLKRFSEDLDFVSGNSFSYEDLKQLSTVVKQYIGDRYGLEVNVKEPKMDSLQSKASMPTTVARWQIAILTNPENKSIPKQKIRIEVVNVPAYTRKLRPLLSNYATLPDGYSETFIYVESLEEILADKIVAFAARDYIKHRDIWDLLWLIQQSVSLQMDLVHKKILDYQIESFPNKLEDRAKQLPQIVKSKAFFNEMSRFLSEKTQKNSLLKDGFDVYLIENISMLLQKVIDQVKGTDAGTKDPKYTL